MRQGQKVKVQGLIDDIQKGRFRFRDIDSLLILLRDYSRDYPTFRDIADFVAHTNDRNRGQSYDSVKRMCTFFRLNIEYITLDKPLDLTNPIPSDFVNFISYQIGTLDNKACKKYLDSSKRRAIANLKKDFAFKGKDATLRKAKFSESSRRAFQIFSERPHVGCTPGQDDLITETLEICSNLGIKIDEQMFRLQSNQITACVLSLLQHCDFESPQNYKCYSEIGFVTNSVGGEKTPPFLQLLAHVEMQGPHQKSGLKIRQSHSLFLTTLLAKEWAPEIVTESSDKGTYKPYEGETTLNETFQLVSADTTMTNPGSRPAPTSHDTSKVIFLVGVDHSVQHDGRVAYEGKEFQQLRDGFPQYLADITFKNFANAIAEESNQEVLNKFNATDSVAREVASSLNLRHLFCEASIEERERMGIKSTADPKDYELRETCWIKKMELVKENPILFVVGASHIESFANLARSRNHQIFVIDPYYGKDYFEEAINLNSNL